MSESSEPSLLLATSNAGKIEELKALLAGLPITLKSLGELVEPAPAVEEAALTYHGNASLKAIALAKWSGQHTLADDSGLEVDALGGAPGVHSARYAGPEQNSQANICKLLAELSEVPSGQRTARFRCVLVVASPTGATLSVEGVCEGRIAIAPSGCGGFGYDPIFLPTPGSSAFAVMPAAEKNRISHRANACRALRGRLIAFLNAGPTATVAAR
ncbi:MAG: RdgB/HAM1 family non-canonical purine NTP pyrophosphatase [Deltaproteobacteria bacterium]|nr:RdgB/HAM1 family non-canonical purine NTP pyrophosphatase [Deltaproteobacteria bacterium]